MAVPEYTKARKLAQKAYHQDISCGRYPYLQVLDELLSFTETVGEQDLGLIEIPIERIVGTKTSGRTKAFAGNFMPLLGESSEFASKWSTLYESHLKEGIHEPVIACEFMNSYYIIEGNKRVSVLKYSGAVNVSGYVTRIIPAPADTDESRIYYEFMDFNRASGINTIYFSRPGSFHELCEATGKTWGEPWTQDERRIFSSCMLHFDRAYHDKGGDRLSTTPGDAFLLYLKVYGYEDMADRSNEELKKSIGNMWSELEALPLSGNVNLIMQPEQEPEKNVIQKLIAPPPQKLTVGFLYYKTADTSSWTYGHNLGRLYLEDNMPGRLSIRVYDGIETDEECFPVIEQAVADGCSVIFTTSPRFIGSSIRAGIKYPQVKILNCSLNTYSGHLRTYYGRLYEAKFLVGMLAGILTRSEYIGYIADYPIVGTTAAINAFALGVKMVNPPAKVLLTWSSEKDCDIKHIFSRAKVSHISGRDMITPKVSSRYFGLYDLDNETGGNLAAAIWHWGKFYQRILQTILNGNWSRTSPDKMGESLNYWWGISSGMIDIICSKSIPERTLKLVELVKKQIINGEFQIFSGDLYDQNHELRNHGAEILSPVDIVKIDWLCDNIVGRIPGIEDLTEEAVPMVEIQGIQSLHEGI